MITLRPGIQGSQLTGQASIPGFYVRFRDGIVDVKDDATIELMKNSDGFKSGDFVAADETGEDPFADTRESIEPAHIISEMKYGHLEGRKVSDTPVKLSPALKKLIALEAQKMAAPLAKEMVREMLPSLLKELSAQSEKEEKPVAKSTVSKNEK